MPIRLYTGIIRKYYHGIGVATASITRVGSLVGLSVLPLFSRFQSYLTPSISSIFSLLSDKVTKGLHLRC